MDQTSGTISTEQPPAAPEEQEPPQQGPSEQTGFGSRGRARRRARFLRRARELAYRDLGGLVFNLHRFGQRNDALVLAKLATLSHIDNELRTIEAALRERQPFTILREAGITACPRCAAIHGSEDRFCPNCGLPLTSQPSTPLAGAPLGSEQAQAVQAPASRPAAVTTPPASSAPTTGAPEPAAASPSSAAQSSGAAASEPASPAQTEPESPADAAKADEPATSADEPAAKPPPSRSRAAGRAPKPSRREQPSSDGEVEEPTEILHPPATGS